MRKARVRDTKAVRTEASRIPKVGRHLAIREARHLAKATKAKEKPPFNGNCHNCGEYGHRAADCPQPRQNRNLGMVAQQQQQQPFNPYSHTQINGVHLW